MDFFHLCRFCLVNSLYHSNIFTETVSSIHLYRLINNIFELKASRNDGLPEYVCVDCFYTIIKLWQLKTQVKEAESTLMMMMKRNENVVKIKEEIDIVENPLPDELISPKEAVERETSASSLDEEMIISYQKEKRHIEETLLGDVGGISQPTVSRIVGRITNLLAIQMIDIIRMPTAVEAQMENRRLFMDLQKRRGHESNRAIPNVDGSIDCIHVRLISTKFQKMAEIYWNCKSYFSLNVQAVVGPRRVFLDLVTNWPGSSHASRIFQNSRIDHRYSTGELTGALLGDAGYQSLPYLFTPFANPQTEGERRYNAAQIRGRNIVERTFGILKKRFPCLSRGLSTKLETSTTIVVACAVLHNMALLVNDLWLDDEEDMEEVPVHHPDDNIVDGLAARREMNAVTPRPSARATIRMTLEE